MRLLILGAGYIGDRFRAAHPGSVATRRREQEGFVRFDLSDTASWQNVPDADAVIWTFPATPVDLALRFRQERLRPDANLIVLGSTSAYVSAEQDQWIDETTPLDLSQPRVEGEERLRESGATVLQLAGIWGPGRDPVRWLVDGRIRNGRKYVNLAHADDILAAIEACLRQPQPDVRINVSDGEPRRWSEHVAKLIAAGQLPASFQLPEVAPGADSKRVRNDRLRSLLPAGYSFHHLTT